MRRLKLWIKLWLMYEFMFIPIALFAGIKTGNINATIISINAISFIALVLFALIGQLFRATSKAKAVETKYPDFSAAFALFEVKQ